MKPFVLTFTSPTQIDLCYQTSVSGQAHGAPVHWVYDSNGKSWTVGRLGPNILSGDQLGGAFNSTFAGIATLAVKPQVIKAKTYPEISSVLDDLANPTMAEEMPLDQVENQPLLPSGPFRYESPRLDLFGLGTDYAMWHQVIWNSIPDSPPQWQSLGGSFISTPEAIAWSDSGFLMPGQQPNRIDVFGLGTDRAVYHKTWNGTTWSQTWDRLGGIFTSEVSAVSWGHKRLDIFARGSDFTLRRRAFDGATWLNDWENLGGSLASQPAAVSWGVNRLDIFAVSNDGTMVHKWWDGTIWNEWENLGVPAKSVTFDGVPCAVTWGPGRLDVFNRGSDGGLYHLAFDQGAWMPIEPLGSGFGPGTSVISPSHGQLLIAAYKSNGVPTTFWYPYNALNFISSNFSTRWLPDRYIFEVLNVDVITTRSLNGDTDTVQSTLNAGNWPVRSGSYIVPNDIGGFQEPKGASIQNCSFGPVTIELCESVVFNYQVMNTTDANGISFLETSGKALASQALGSITKLLGDGFTAITSIEVGSLSDVPVFGPILGVVQSYLLDQLKGIVLAKCDGLVAVEQVVKLGKDLPALTATGPYTVTTSHAGTNSNVGCGPHNSRYTVQWRVRRA